MKDIRRLLLITLMPVLVMTIVGCVMPPILPPELPSEEPVNDDTEENPSDVVPAPELIELEAVDAQLLSEVMGRGTVTPDDGLYVVPNGVMDALLSPPARMTREPEPIIIEMTDLPAYPVAPVTVWDAPPADLPSGAAAYFISSSVGDDHNSGLTPAQAWKSLDTLSDIPLGPGDRVYLKRGDRWDGEKLHLRGKGMEGNPVMLLSYGDGDRPLIVPGSQKRGIGVQIENPSYWEIWDLDVRDAKLGLYLRYDQSFGNRDVTIRNCRFVDMYDFDSNPAFYNFEYAFNCGIWLSGRTSETKFNDPNYQDDLESGRWVSLEGLEISHCSFENNAMGFGTNWYYLGEDMAHLKDLHIHDCEFTKPTAGALALNFVDTGLIERVRIHERARFEEVFQWGSAGSIVFSCKDLVFDHCEFSEVGIMPWFSGDGCGIDIDGRNERITLQNSIFHDNSSNGLLMLSTSANNTAYGIEHPVVFNQEIIVQNNIFYNNGLAPNNWMSRFGGDGWAIKMANSGSSGIIRDNWFFKSPYQYGYLSNNNRIDAYPGLPGESFELSGNQYGYYDPRSEYKGSADPIHSEVWNFHRVNDTEGFEFYGDWDPDSMKVRGKAYSTTSTEHSEENYLKGNVQGYGILQSPEFSVDASTEKALEMRIFTTSALEAVLYFQTEDDPTWSEEKSVRFDTQAARKVEKVFKAYVDMDFRHNDLMVDYLYPETISIDLTDVAAWDGTITKFAICFPCEAHTDLGIDWISISEYPLEVTL